MGGMDGARCESSGSSEGPDPDEDACKRAASFEHLTRRWVMRQQPRTASEPRRQCSTPWRQNRRGAPRSMTSRWMMRQSACRAPGSMPVDGSSSSTTAGAPTSATATASLRLLPPLYDSHTLRARQPLTGNPITMKHAGYASAPVMAGCTGTSLHVDALHTGRRCSAKIRRRAGQLLPGGVS